jgi:N-acyl-D-amino-acid deacylase
LFALKVVNGTVFDGSGCPGYRADIGIIEGKIAAVGRLDGAAAAETIDAEGLCVAPGFIDSHSHSDDWYFDNPWAVSKILQGVTTEIVGHCGDSPAPRAATKALTTAAGRKVTWQTVAEFRSALEFAGIGVNVAMLAGHGSIRTLVMGGDARPPFESELAAMARLVGQALTEGAIGLSSGLAYPPGCHAASEELTALAACLKPSGGIYTSHIRDEADDLLPSLQETLAVGAAAGVRCVVSHLKAAGRLSRGRAAAALTILQEARSRGVDVFCDIYPYTALSTTLAALLPPWTHDGGPAARRQRLADPGLREALVAAVATRGADLDDIVITRTTAAEHRKFIGQKLPAVAACFGLPVAEAAVELLAASGGEVSMIWHAMGEEDVKAVLEAPFSIIGSDAGARLPYGPLAIGLPHPRAYGTFPRFLARYVRDGGMMPLPAAIAKLTGLPATVYRLPGRGRIACGYWADLTIFDYWTVNDRATYENPFRTPDGIVHVLVNGVPAVRRGLLEYRLAGRYITL